MLPPKYFKQIVLTRMCSIHRVLCDEWVYRHGMLTEHPARASNTPMKLLLPGTFALLALASAHAQDAHALISASVQAELAADHNDHTAYCYLDHDVTPEHDTLFYTVETPQGILRRKLEDHGRKLTSEEQRADDTRLQELLKDSAEQARRHKEEAHDDEQAQQMLRLLPEAFVWTIVAQTADSTTLEFKPDPAYQAKDMEAKVFAVMAGRVVIARPSNRLQSMQGKLMSDVKIVGGLFGRLQQGGTFHVERREVAPGHWQIVTSNVHISGHVFFKTIGSQEDEQRAEFKVSTAQTLQQAYEQIGKR